MYKPKWVTEWQRCNEQMGAEISPDGLSPRIKRARAPSPHLIRPVWREHQKGPLANQLGQVDFFASARCGRIQTESVVWDTQKHLISCALVAGALYEVTPGRPPEVAVRRARGSEEDR